MIREVLLLVEFVIMSGLFYRHPCSFAHTRGPCCFGCHDFRTCSMATLIGLCVRVKLLRSLPSRFKVTVRIAPGTHSSEAAGNMIATHRDVCATNNDYTSLQLYAVMGFHVLGFFMYGNGAFTGTFQENPAAVSMSPARHPRI